MTKNNFVVKLNFEQEINKEGLEKYDKLKI